MSSIIDANIRLRNIVSTVVAGVLLSFGLSSIMAAFVGRPDWRSYPVEYRTGQLELMADYVNYIDSVRYYSILVGLVFMVAAAVVFLRWRRHALLITISSVVLLFFGTSDSIYGEWFFSMSATPRASWTYAFIGLALMMTSFAAYSFDRLYGLFVRIEVIMK